VAGAGVTAAGGFDATAGGGAAGGGAGGVLGRVATGGRLPGTAVFGAGAAAGGGGDA
jgi:hypothetical protein